MAHYILADDFDFDSIIIKSISFDNVGAILKLVFTYNDGNELSASVDLSDTFASTDYVAESITNALKPYSTTDEVGVQIANALTEYDKSSVVTNKINEAIANALNDYYNKAEVDNKVANKSVAGVAATYDNANNSINVKVTQNDGTSANGNVTIPNASNTASGLITAAQTLKLSGIASNANNYVLPAATGSALGGIKADTGDDTYTSPVKIKSDGKLYTTPGQYDLKIASPTNLGGVKPTALKTSIYNIAVAVDTEGGLWTIAGSYILPTASTSELGGVKIGSGINISDDGTISAQEYTLPTATSSVLGGVKIGSGINISNGVISVPTYSLPTMSASTKGGAKVGSGLKVESEVLSVETDGVTTGIQGNAVEVLTDGETIQAGTNGLEVKVDNSTIKVGDNGLEAVGGIGAIDLTDIVANVSVRASASGRSYFTLNVDGWLYIATAMSNVNVYLNDKSSGWDWSFLIMQPIPFDSGTYGYIRQTVPIKGTNYLLVHNNTSSYVDIRYVVFGFKE